MRSAPGVDSSKLGGGGSGRYCLSAHSVFANDSSEPKGQELNYSARISLDRTAMQIDDEMVKLSPGMAVTVEIKTGSRKILDYLLSPLLRYRQEMLRER